MKDYFESRINIRDGIMISEAVPYISVMSEQEKFIMEQSAKVICANGGDILNVGYGLGIIDSYIAGYDIKTHTIIEAHHDVLHYALDNAPLGASILFGKWENVIIDLIKQDLKFDGIYFDTINVPGNNNQWSAFARIVDLILKPGGTFAYFNHTAAASEPHFDSIIRSYQWEQHWVELPYEKIQQNSPVEMDTKSLRNENYLLTWLNKK